MADDQAEFIEARRYDTDRAYREQFNREERERLRAWAELSPAVLEEIKASRLRPRPPPPVETIDEARRYDTDPLYRENANQQERQQPRGSPLIEITRAELDQVKAQVAARPTPAKDEAAEIRDARRYDTDRAYRKQVNEQEREKSRTAILDISGDIMRAWVETKDEYAARAKREAAVDARRYDIDRAYRELVNEQERQHRGEQVVIIKLKDFERPKASPSPA